MENHVFNLDPPISLVTWNEALSEIVNSIFNGEAYHGSGIAIRLLGNSPVVDGITVQTRESFEFSPDNFLKTVNSKISLYGTIFVADN